MWGQERANARTASGRTLPSARWKMVAVQKGASKETSFEEGAHGDPSTDNGEREGKSMVTPRRQPEELIKTKSHMMQRQTTS